MRPERLKAFSDGVFAIIITIMVLEIKVPKAEDGDTFNALVPMLPSFLAYLFSFIYVGIYWNNHHHLFQIVDTISGSVLWANLSLLFCLSLVPVSTAWMGEHFQSAAPVVLYGIILLLCGATYRYLVVTLTRCDKTNQLLAESIGNDFKGIISLVIYLIGIAVAFWKPYLGIICFVVVAIVWFIPDKRMESRLKSIKE